MREPTEGQVESAPNHRTAMLVGLLCAGGAGLALWGSLDLVHYLRTLQSSKLANAPRLGLLQLTCAILAGAALVLVAASWRTWRHGTPQRREALRMSPAVLLLWALVGGWVLAVNYPIPAQAHHTDKFLLAVLVVTGLSAWFLFHPASLSAWRAGRLSRWMTIGLLNIVVFVAIGEAVLRLADPVLARSGLFGDKQTPANLRPHTPVRGSIGVTNSQGFRDRERGVERTGAGPRVIALGDSMTWGAGVSYDDAFVTLLELGLQLADPGAEVLNLGVPAWGPHEEFHLLQAYGVRFLPDLVMLNFFVGNDIQNKRGDDTNLPRILVVAGQSYYVHSNGNWVHDTLGPDRWYLYHNLNYLVRVGGSRTFHLAQARTGEMRGEWAPLVSRPHYLKGIHERSDIYLKEDTLFFTQHWARTQAILLAMLDFLQARGIPFLVVVIPDHVQLDRSLQNEYLSSLQLSSESYDFEKPQRLLRAWCSENGIRSLDLLPTFLDQPDPGALYFQNDIHWTPKGHALAAAAISTTLQELTRVRDGRRLADVQQR